MIPAVTISPMYHYSLFGTIGTVVLFCCNLYQIVRQKPPLSRHLCWVQNRLQQIPVLGNFWFWAVIESLLFSCAQYLLVGLTNTTFGNWVGTGGNYFGLITMIPLLILLFCFLFWTDPLKKFDLLVPAFPLALVFVKIACFCAGCCRGFECSWGMYNYFYGFYEFPTQLLEAAVALALFFVMMKLRGKMKPGTMWPVYVLLYSGTRFFTEFTRHESNTIWFLKTYHLCCIGGLIYGAVLLRIVKKHGDKISNFFDSRMDKFNTSKS